MSHRIHINLSELYISGCPSRAKSPVSKSLQVRLENFRKISATPDKMLMAIALSKTSSKWSVKGHKLKTLHNKKEPKPVPFMQLIGVTQIAHMNMAMSKLRPMTTHRKNLYSARHKGSASVGFRRGTERFKSRERTEKLVQASVDELSSW